TVLHAEEQGSCSIAALSCLGSAVGGARLVLQPAVQLIPSRWPVVDIWNAHQRSIIEWPDAIARRSSYTQATRIGDRIRLSSLSAGRYAFRRGLARGLSLDAAFHLAMS